MADDAERFLRGFHARHPGLTSAVMGQAPSYAALVASAAPGARVLDLGCGDGHLLAALVAAGHAPAALCGVDLSEAELAAAARRQTGAALVQARAQALPFAAASFDHVVSHLGFVLMAPAEAVIAELARVVRPGGAFATIVGGGPRGDDAFAGLLALAAPLLRAAGVPPLGDRRVRTDEALAAAFAGPAWAGVTIEDRPVDLSGPPDRVWALVTAQYQLADQPAAALAALRGRFDAALPGWQRPDGAIACTMATRLVVARRAPAAR